jgi:hypothetical protein
MRVIARSIGTEGTEGEGGIKRRLKYAQGQWPNCSTCCSIGKPHWMMMAGAILVAAGFIGLAFHRNRNVEPIHEED